MKNLFMLALTGTIVTFAADTPVTFKGPNLAAVAAQSLPAGQPAGPVTETQAPTVAMIRSEETIRDLGRMEKLTGLRFLYLAKSEISDLRPLAGLANLESITIKGGSIMDLSPLANLKKLTFIMINGNQIQDLNPLAGLTQLQHLDLSGNRIADLSPLTSLANLEWLRLENNQVSDMSPINGATRSAPPPSPRTCQSCRRSSATSPTENSPLAAPQSYVMPAASALSSDEQLHWLALRMTPGLGSKTAISLIEHFRTPQAIFRASKSELEAAGTSIGLARNISSGCAFEDAVTQQQKVADVGATVIPFTSQHYPARLKEIYDPPPILFARGRVELLDTLALAVVGTRRPSAYGTSAATRLSKDLADAGLTISSGMARGIDTAAHKAVLETGGNTIAVFGCGVDELYPAENRKLAAQLAESGLILSDFPMGTPPYPQNFPIRNRIISGISLGVLIVEGGQYSGSAITARLASEHNREVFAVPGNITSKMSWGPNLLIKQGAKLVQDWNDVVTELKPEDRRWLVRQCRDKLNLTDELDPESSQTSLDLGPMTEIGRAILHALTPDAPVPLDHLVVTLIPHSPSEIIATLFELEINGLIRQLPGKSFLKVWSY